MLEIRHLSKMYRARGRQVPAVTDVSLSLSPGEFVAVQGPSGCGKSTLLLAAGALLRPDAGQVLLDGTDVYALSPEGRAQFRAQHLGFVFQQFHLIPYLSVLDNVLAAGMARPGVDQTEHARELLARFGLTHRSTHTPSELSTGERQRTAMARALLNRPALLLADEPTGNLDPDNADIVLTHLRQFAAGGGMVMLVTHDRQAAGRADRIIELAGGKITTGLEAHGVSP